MEISTVFSIVFALITGLACGAAGSWWFLRNSSKQSLEIARQSEQLAARQELADANSQTAHYQAQANELQKQVQQLQTENQNIRAAQLQDARVLEQLAPVAENLATLRNKVTELEQQRAAQHGELVGQLKQATATEQQLLATSQKLAQALSSTSGRGRWGETSLRRLFELSGMSDHVDFAEQVTVTAPQKQRPDFIVHLPNERKIVVDAKAPLAALLNLPPSATDKELKAAQAAHAAALRNHIKTLAARDYSGGVPGSVELVLAFVPSDDLLSHAFAGDPGLHELGYENRVVLVSPATLFPTLKAIEYSWRQQAISTQAQQIYAIGAELYERLSTFGDNICKLGAALNKSVGAYNTLVGSVQSRLLPAARRISSINPQLLSKNITALADAEISDSVRQVTAPEYTTDNASSQPTKPSRLPMQQKVANE